ncbi:alpha/beta hydrolase [Aliiglaciecola litoralis]
MSFAQADDAEIKNVSYSSILELSYRAADATLVYGDDKHQFGKLWRPSVKSSGLPALVVFIHGGCWLNAFDIDHSFPLTSALSEQGFLVWSIEYRRTGDEGGGWPGSFQDIQAGIDYILNQSQETFDPNKVFVVGHSAGGHLATLAADQRNGKVTAIGLAAITDVAKYGQGKNSCQQAVPKFMGGSAKQKPDDYAQATAKSFVHSILLHGLADKIVPPSQSSQTKAQTVLIADAGHFDFLHPKSTAFAALLATLTAPRYDSD